MKLRNLRSGVRISFQGCAIVALFVANALCLSVPTQAAGSAASSESTALPSYYPKDYQKIVDAAKEEGGKLVIYSSFPQEMWNPVFKAFQEQYPFVTDIKSLNMQGEEVYQKLLVDSSRGVAGADIVEIQPNVGAMLKQEEHKQPGKLLLKYQSPEAGQYERDLVEPIQNVYQYAIAGLLIGYNTKLITAPVQSIEDVANVLKSPKGSTFTIGIRDIKQQFAFTGYYTLLNAKPELWSAFETILAHSKPEASSASLVTKLQTGEYAAAVLVSDSLILSAVKQSKGLLQFAIPKDGTPFIGTSVAIAAKSVRPNTAKLLVDFMLSQKGQQAVLSGGRPAIRAGLQRVEGLYSFDEENKAIPKGAAVIVPYDEVPTQKADEFAKRWNALRKVER